MFLHKTKKKDSRVYLAITEAYRECKRTRQRTVESLGYLVRSDFGLHDVYCCIVTS